MFDYTCLLTNMQALNVTKAIKDIRFSVEAGEFLGIMGASGSGKTTLLNCISTIDTVSAGHIFLEGTDVTEIKPKSLARFRRENLGVVFQDFNLLDTLTVSENIALALTINKTPAAHVEPHILDMAKKLNISDILSKLRRNIDYGNNFHSDWYFPRRILFPVYHCNALNNLWKKLSIVMDTFS